jgi:hypothetical protein
VHVLGHHLGQAQRLLVGEIEHELRRRLRALRHLELDAHAVDDQFLAGLLDVLRRRNETRRIAAQCQAQAGAQRALAVGGQRHAVHVVGAPRHRVAGEHVLGDRVLHELVGGDDFDLARAHVGLVDHAAHAAEVVGVAVRVDHRDHRLRALQRVHRQLQPGLRHRRREHGVDDDPAGPAFDQRHVGDVVAADLVDAVGHLEQALCVLQLLVAPQAGVGAGRCVALQEVELARVPHDAAVGGLDQRVVQLGQLAACGVVEVALVERGHRLAHRLVGAGRRRRGRFGRQVAGGWRRRAAGGQQRCGQQRGQGE